MMFVAEPVLLASAMRFAPAGRVVLGDQADQDADERAGDERPERAGRGSVRPAILVEDLKPRPCTTKYIARGTGRRR
jgi:hypothetical protein